MLFWKPTAIDYFVPTALIIRVNDVIYQYFVPDRTKNNPYMNRERRTRKDITVDGTTKQSLNERSFSC